jgi:hypothetical protein
LGTVEQSAAQPSLQSGHLFADGPVRDKKFFGGLGKADVPCGGFKGSDRIQGWKFSHTPILPKL